MSTTIADQVTSITDAMVLSYFHSWRRMRRAAHEALTKVAVQRYHPIQTKEATILVSALLADPENRDNHFQRASASTIMSILYDHPTLTSAQDMATQDMYRITQLVLQAASRTSIVEFFPWMLYTPQRSNICQCLFLIHIQISTGLRSGRGKSRR